ncbi:MAG: ribonuclease P protein component [Lentisphaerae bacterium]|nr:ribonuclease P protein component [Lentisphaerota bacterium]
MRDVGEVAGTPHADLTPIRESETDQGFSRQQRIVLNSDYQRVFARNRRRAGRYQVLWIDSGSSSTPRVGVIASKRTFRRAVDRARAKRLLREAFRLNRERFDPHTDCVLVARRAIMDAGRHAVERELLELARHCGVLRRSEEGA